jgi:hypothetical protein
MQSSRGIRAHGQRDAPMSCLFAAQTATAHPSPFHFSKLCPKGLIKFIVRFNASMLVLKLNRFAAKLERWVTKPERWVAKLREKGGD